MGAKRFGNRLLAWIGKHIRGAVKPRRMQHNISGVSPPLRDSPPGSCQSCSQPRLTKITKTVNSVNLHLNEADNVKEIGLPRTERSKISTGEKEVNMDNRPGQRMSFRKIIEDEHRGHKKHRRTEEPYRRSTALVVEELYKKRKANRVHHKGITTSPKADGITEDPLRVNGTHGTLEEAACRNNDSQVATMTRHSPNENLQGLPSEKKIHELYCDLDLKSKQLQEVRPQATHSREGKKQPARAVAKTDVRSRCASAPLNSQTVLTKGRVQTSTKSMRTCSSTQSRLRAASPLGRNAELTQRNKSEHGINESVSQLDARSNESKQKTKQNIEWNESTIEKRQTARARLNELKKQWLNDATTSARQTPYSVSQAPCSPICTSVNDQTWKSLHPNLRSVRNLKDRKVEATKMGIGESEKLSPKEVSTSDQLKDEPNPAQLESEGPKLNESNARDSRPLETLFHENETFKLAKGGRKEDHALKSGMSGTNSIWKIERQSKEGNPNGEQGRLDQQTRPTTDKNGMLWPEDSSLLRYSSKISLRLGNYEEPRVEKRYANIDGQAILPPSTPHSRLSYVEGSTESMETGRSFRSQYEYPPRHVTRSLETAKSFRSQYEYPPRNLSRRAEQRGSVKELEECNGKVLQSEPLRKRNDSNQLRTGFLADSDCELHRKSSLNIRSTDGVYQARKIYLPRYQPYFTLYLNRDSPRTMQATKSKGISDNRSNGQ